MCVPSFFAGSGFVCCLFCRKIKILSFWVDDSIIILHLINANKSILFFT